MFSEAAVLELTTKATDVPPSTKVAPRAAISSRLSLIKSPKPATDVPPSSSSAKMMELFGSPNIPSSSGVAADMPTYEDISPASSQQTSDVLSQVLGMEGGCSPSEEELELAAAAIMEPEDALNIGKTPWRLQEEDMGPLNLTAVATVEVGVSERVVETPAEEATITTAISVQAEERSETIISSTPSILRRCLEDGAVIAVKKQAAASKTMRKRTSSGDEQDDNRESKKRKISVDDEDDDTRLQSVDNTLKIVHDVVMRRREWRAACLKFDTEIEEASREEEDLQIRLREITERLNEVTQLKKNLIAKKRKCQEEEPDKKIRESLKERIRRLNEDMEEM